MMARQYLLTSGKGKGTGQKIATSSLPHYQATNAIEIEIDISIQKGTSIMVSDGSFKENWGTSALIIEGDISSICRITEKCTTPGHSEDQEAYMIELSGIIH